MGVDAIVLAGGRATRLGGIDKPALVVGDTSLLDRAVAAVSDSRRVVVVGPRRTLAVDIADLSWTREDPLHGGPVAAVAAGMAELGEGGDEDVTVVLAADLPWLDRDHVNELVEALTASEESDAVFASDSAGVTQYLVGAWRAQALRRALNHGGSPAGRSMRSVVPDRFATVALSGTADIDTPEDLDRELGTATMTLDDARERVLATVRSMPPRRVEVRDSAGSVLAEQLRARSDFPRFDTSAMDGYAVAGDGPWTLRGDVATAGSSATDPLVDAIAVRIATGAQVPMGATSVIRDEHVVVSGKDLARAPGAPARHDVRLAGEDWRSGDVLAEPGIPVTAAVISTAVSADVEDVQVRGPALVRTVVSGDEIRSRGPLGPGQIRDSVGPVLPMFLHQCGFRSEREVHTMDSEGGFDEVLSAATDVDVVVVVGATGGGAADRLRGSLGRLGARVVVGSIACRPGGSTVIAVLPDRRVVFGLPGNPYAAVATLLALGPSISEALTASARPVPRTGELIDAPEPHSSTRLVPVKHVGENRWKSAPSNRTAHLAALIGCDGVAVVPPAAVSGARVEILPLPPR